MFKGTKRIAAITILIAVFFALALSGCDMGGTSADGGESTGGGGLTSFLPLILIVVVFYFILIRPQNKKNKDTAKMRDSIKRGDHITTIGGFRGRVVRVHDDDSITIEVGADKVKLDVMRWGISKVEAEAPARKSTKDEKEDAPEPDEDKAKRKPRKLTAAPKAEEKPEESKEPESTDDDADDASASDE